MIYTLTLNQPAPFGGHNERNNMRIYEVKNASGKIVCFARSFDQAKAVVKENSPSARKVYSSGDMTEFSSCFVIYAIEIKPDKEGILNKLNSLVVHDRIIDPEEPKEVEEIEVLPTPPVQNNKTPEGISPAIEFTGNGQGTCLHCRKTVGYVGGFPRVNPPAEILDN